jgi:hypothetical protein
MRIFFSALYGDTTSYTAVKTGEEMINGVKTQIINVIPTEDTADLILENSGSMMQEDWF